jgi:hypothetical protein
MMGLPVLIFGAQIEGSWMLEIRGENNGFVTSLSRQLHPKVPGVKGDKGKFEVVGDEVLLSELVEPIYGITEAASITDMFPSEGCEGSYWERQAPGKETIKWRASLTAKWSDWSVDGFDEDGLPVELLLLFRKNWPVAAVKEGGE